MGRFVVILSGEGVQRQIDLERLAAALVQEGWRRADVPGGVVAMSRVGPSFIAQSGPNGVFVGELYDADGEPVGRDTIQTLLTTGANPESEILERFWGRYVLITLDTQGRPNSVLRSPSAGLEAFVWQALGCTVIASEPIPLVLAQLTPDLSIDIDVLAAYLVDLSTISTHSPLRGVRLIPPGARLDLAASGRLQQVWRPAHFGGAPTPVEPAPVLMAALSAAVRGLANHRAILAEVSGGLDSSIVAASLREVDADVRGWLNLAVEQRAGDERGYARQLAAHLGILLTEVIHAPLVFEPEALAAVAVGFTPSLDGLDVGHDQDLANAAEAAGADAIMSGLGGDTVFFSAHSTLIIQDRVARLGWRAWRLGFLGDLGRWTRRSAYALIKLGLSPRELPEFPLTPPTWIKADRGRYRHPWLEAAEGLSPAKHLQLQSLTYQLADLGTSRRGRRFDMLYPFLAQPVIEASLATPIDLLVEGGRDRALARRAFVGRLPDAILQRRSKGDLSQRFASALVEGLPALKAFLIDGRLAAMGLIDRDGLYAALDESLLAQRGGASQPFRVAAIEAWVRHWEGMAAALGTPFDGAAR